jgi:hypothetical protein
VLVREPVEGGRQRLVFRIADGADLDRLAHGAPAVAGPMPFEFVTAPKTPLQSMHADTQVCNFKALKLLYRATPPGPTTWNFCH